MSHRLPCPNGHVLLIPPRLEGKRIKCPKCQALMEVPIMTAAEEEEEIITEAAEEEAPKPLPRPSTRVKEGSAAPPPEIRYDIEDDENGRRPKRRAAKDDADGDEPRPKGRRDLDEDRPPRRSRNEQDDWDDDDELDEKAKKKLNRIRWRRTRVGLLLYYIQFIVYLSIMLATGLGFLLFLVSPAIGVIFLLYGMCGVYLIAPALGITGGAFIVYLPPKTGLRPWAIATLVTAIIPVASGILAILTGAIASGFRSGEGLFLTLMFITLAGASLVAGFIIFMLFLSRLATYLSDRGTAGEARSLMISFLCLQFGGPFVIGIIATIGRLISRPAGGILALFAMLAWFIMIVSSLLKILQVISIIRARV